MKLARLLFILILGCGLVSLSFSETITSNNSQSPEKDIFFMQQALQVAAEGLKNNERHIGAIIVDSNGNIVTSSYNTINKHHDISGHAEVNAIRKACLKLQSKTLQGMTIYTTWEPCPMCLQMILETKISRLVYGKTKDINSPTQTMSKPVDFSTQIKSSGLQVTGGILAELCEPSVGM